MDSTLHQQRENWLRAALSCILPSQPCTCRVQEREAVLSKFVPANASSKQLAKHDIQRVHVTEKLKQCNCLGICSMGLIRSVFHALKSVRYQDSQPSHTALCLKCWPSASSNERGGGNTSGSCRRISDRDASLGTECQNGKSPT